VSVIVKFIDDNRQEFGVEPIVRVLRNTPARIATSSYYAYKKRLPSERARRDEGLKVAIMRIFEENYSVYGARKIWHALNRDYADAFGPVARCTVERLMRRLGIPESRVKANVRRPLESKRTRGACTRRSFWTCSPGRSWAGR